MTDEQNQIGKIRDGAFPGVDSSPSAAPMRYRRRPDVVEAMKYDPSDPVSFQGVLSWLRDEGQKFKTVGRQVWVEWGDRGEQFVLHPGDYLIRKTEGRRFFYIESPERFEEARERVE